MPAKKSENGRSTSTRDPERADVICEQIEHWMCVEGRHTNWVLRELMKTFGFTRSTAKQWIQRVRLQWRESQDEELLADKQNQLEQQAHSLYALAIGDKDWHRIKDLLAQLGGPNDKAVREQLKALLDKPEPNLGAATRVLRNLMSLYGMGNTLRIEVGGGSSR